MNNVFKHFGFITIAAIMGKTWTAVANTASFSFTSSTSGFHTIAYGNGRFLAVGEAGKMAYFDW